MHGQTSGVDGWQSILLDINLIAASGYVFYIQTLASRVAAVAAAAAASVIAAGQPARKARKRIRPVSIDGGEERHQIWTT